MVPPARHLHPFLKRTSKVIRDRRSFRVISVRADQLERGSAGCSSSDAVAVATFFLNTSQEAVETRLREQQHLHHLGFHRLIDLLRFSAYCSWRASLLCAALFTNILDAKVSIARIQSILDSPSCHSQVADLLLALADLRRLFSEETLAKIRHGKDLLNELVDDLKCHREKTRVRALSGISAMKRKTRDGVLPVMRHLKASLRSKLCMCSTAMNYGSHSKNRGVLIGDNGRNNDSNDEFDGSIDEAEQDSSVVSLDSDSSQRNVNTSLHKVHMRLHQIERSMFGVSRTLETLVPIASGTHNQGLSPHLIELLRDDPLMFDGVAAQIASCNESLSNHLDDVREQILNCFCFINRARDHVYEV